MKFEFINSSRKKRKCFEIGFTVFPDGPISEELVAEFKRSDAAGKKSIVKGLLPPDFNGKAGEMFNKFGPEDISIEMVGTKKIKVFFLKLLKEARVSNSKRGR